MTGESGMRDGTAHGEWARASTLAVAYAGTEAGAADAGPAIRALLRRTPRAVLLWPEGVEPPERDGAALVPYAVPLGLDEAARRLAQAAPWGAVVLAEPGWTPLEAAHLCYIAGVRRRAGFAAEFAGVVLSDPVPEPAHAPGPERHLALLAALGLDRPEAPR